eukprot:XP_022279599.1 centrosomal protein of 131 kDa [Canis lupus familiaris]
MKGSRPASRPASTPEGSSEGVDLSLTGLPPPVSWRPNSASTTKPIARFSVVAGSEPRRKAPEGPGGSRTVNNLRRSNSTTQVHQPPANQAWTGAPRPAESPHVLTLSEGSPGGKKRAAGLSKTPSEKAATWNVLDDQPRAFASPPDSRSPSTVGAPVGPRRRECTVPLAPSFTANNRSNKGTVGNCVTTMVHNHYTPPERAPPPKSSNHTAPSLNNILKAATGAGGSGSFGKPHGDQAGSKHVAQNNTGGAPGPLRRKEVTEEEAERFIHQVNRAAVTIQRWYRHQVQRRQARAARLEHLPASNQEEQRRQLGGDSLLDQHQKKEAARRKAREEKARQARRAAIQELQQKRAQKSGDPELKEAWGPEKPRPAQELPPRPGGTTHTPQTHKANNAGEHSRARGPHFCLRPVHPQGHQPTPTPVEDMVPPTTQKQTFTDTLGWGPLHPLAEGSGRLRVASVGLPPLCPLQDASAQGMPGEDLEVGGPAQSRAKSRVTLDELLDTLKLLEEEPEPLPRPRAYRKDKYSWTDEEDDASNLTADNLERFGKLSTCDGPSEDGTLLSEAKLQSIMSFLHEMEMEQLGQDRPASAPQGLALEDGRPEPGSTVSTSVMRLKLEVEEKKQAVGLLQRALMQQRDLTVRRVKETEKELGRQLRQQRDHYEATIQRHLSFIDQVPPPGKGAPAAGEGTGTCWAHGVVGVQAGSGLSETSRSTGLLPSAETGGTFPCGNCLTGHPRHHGVPPTAVTCPCPAAVSPTHALRPLAACPPRESRGLVHPPCGARSAHVRASGLWPTHGVPASGPGSGHAAPAPASVPSLPWSSFLLTAWVLDARVGAKGLAVPLAVSRWRWQAVLATCEPERPPVWALGQGTSPVFPGFAGRGLDPCSLCCAGGRHSQAPSPARPRCAHCGQLVPTPRADSARAGTSSFFFFLRFIYLRERACKQTHKWEGGRERRGRGSQAGSLQSVEPNPGRDPTTLRSLPDPKPRVGRLTDRATRRPSTSMPKVHPALASAGSAGARDLGCPVGPPLQASRLDPASTSGEGRMGSWACAGEGVGEAQGSLCVSSFLTAALGTSPCPCWQEIKKLKELMSATEKVRREKWINEKTRKIKEITVRGKEPEIQKLIARHKQEVKKLKSVHEAELLQADARAAQRCARQVEELREQLEREKEALGQQERERAQQRFEQHVEQEQRALQQQRRRLYGEVAEEKERLGQQAARQRAELEELRRQLEESSAAEGRALRAEFEKGREEQERRHQMEMKALKDQLEAERQMWEANCAKKEEAWLLTRERELREEVRRGRDKEIELVIHRLEADMTRAREESERAAESRVQRLRDKYDAELSELEQSERKLQDRCTELKGRLGEAEGEGLRLQGLLRHKEKELARVTAVNEQLVGERSGLAEVLRREFADRLAASEEDTRVARAELAELRARQRLELEQLSREKQAELEEVHQRVKLALTKKEEAVRSLRKQHEAAVKRADHLEELLEQRKWPLSSAK